MPLQKMAGPGLVVVQLLEPCPPLTHGVWPGPGPGEGRMKAQGLGPPPPQQVLLRALMLAVLQQQVRLHLRPPGRCPLQQPAPHQHQHLQGHPERVQWH